MRARVAFAGTIHEAAPRRGGTAAPPDGTAEIELADGRVLREEQVVWLPPFEAGKAPWSGLGLNYAGSCEGARLRLAAQEPLVFLEGARSPV